MKMDKENITVKTQSSGNLMVVSLILMVLSCVLFVGTTLAWFTDQTSGGVNRIQAGNLEAELWIGEKEPYPVKLDPPSGAQPVSAGTAVPLQLHKLNVEGNAVVGVSESAEESWIPGDIFISDVMRVEKVNGSVPFAYELKLSFDPETEEPAEDPASTNGESGETETEETPEETPPKAEDYIDFRIVNVSTISSLSTGENQTRTYQYDAITDYFPEELTEPEEGSAPTLPAPIWSSDVGWSAVPPQGETPTNVFSSELANNEEPTENVTPVQFVILAKLKQPNTGTEDIELSNPFSLIVTLKQLKAEHFEPAAKAGDAS